MSRVEIFEVVRLPEGHWGSSVSVTVRARSDNSLATLYGSETGSSIANPTTTDSMGRINAWVDAGQYNLTYTLQGEAYTVAFNAAHNVGSGQALSVVTSLPGSPSDGQEILFLADASNRVLWHLRYRSASGSSYKWEYLGGEPIHAVVDTSESTASAVYVDLTTPGPTLTTPLAGDYLLMLSVFHENGNFIHNSQAALKFGAAATADADTFSQFVSRMSNPTLSSLHEAQRRYNGLAASTVIKPQYKVVAAPPVTFSFRRLSMVPVRVG